MAFRSWPTTYSNDAPTAAEQAIESAVRERQTIWTSRAIPETLRRAAARNASEWTRTTLAWHLEVLQGILPTSTLREIEPHIARRLVRKALDDMAERWLATQMR